MCISRFIRGETWNWTTWSLRQVPTSPCWWKDKLFQPHEAEHDHHHTKVLSYLILTSHSLMRKLANIIRRIQRCLKSLRKMWQLRMNRKWWEGFYNYSEPQSESNSEVFKSEERKKKEIQLVPLIMRLLKIILSKIYCCWEAE